MLTSWGWPTHLYHLVPLGWAFAAAGHEVRLVSQPALADRLGATGLTGVVVGEDADLLSPEVRERAGMPFDRLPPQGAPPDYAKMWRSTTVRMEVLADAMIDGVTSFAEAWRPDLMVWDWMTFAAPLAARRLGLPSARLVYGPDMFPRMREAAQATSPGVAEEWLTSLYARHGVAGPVEADSAWGGDWCLDTCPPSAQLPSVKGLPMRFVPYNGPLVAPAWVARPARRRRICVTMGTSARRLRGEDSVSLPTLLEGLAELDAEVVVAGTGEQRRGLEPLPDNAVFVEYVPLHALLPGSDVLVHQGGAGSAMSAASCGVPQVVAAAIADQPFMAERFASVGAAVHVPAVSGCEEAVVAGVRTVLDDPSYRVAAGRLREEMLRQPTPSEVAVTLSDLVRDHAVR
ncbi:nucleotide disphospho-sugar-binding domain-containing protein [Streptomyces tendae]|uniref:nucleotide disphospho-sugar-binding domain-containing protein n=1 Tax=Streptomyces tendae TaxID=1932 RepID=UPI003685A0AC